MDQVKRTVQLAVALALSAFLTGCVGLAAGPVNPVPTVQLTASSTEINPGQSITLTWTSDGATSAQLDNGLGSAQPTGSMSVTPTETTTYTITVSGPGGSASSQVTVTVITATIDSIKHVIFMLQENRSFDTYFGMLNAYRAANAYNVGDDGVTYNVDGIENLLTTFTNQDDEGEVFSPFKLSSTCIDDMTSSWIESYGDVNRYDFSTTRPILMDGFVHVAENFAKGGFGGGTFTDLQGRRAMGYYDQDYLNYYYFMASQFALSDRWFTPFSGESIPNRIATMTGGTTQGLVRDPGADDHLPQLAIPTIFQKLQDSSVSWKIYYSVTQDQCLVDPAATCKATTINKMPATTFSYFTDSVNYLYAKSPERPTCTGSTQSSGTAVNDPNDAFCIDTTHIVPLTKYFTDLTSDTLPSFAYIEAGYSNNDEHPGSGQSILDGQGQMAVVINSLMTSPSWPSSVFFFSYDEAGGPFDHVPPVPGHTNDFTDASLGITTDISSIAVNPDQYNPCVPADGIPTIHCDLFTTDPGAHPTDATTQQGFAAQLGFRVPNFIVSPFSRKHYVSHTPLDHTAVIKFVETHFIDSSAHLTSRDAAQPDLLEFFDFKTPWAIPPIPPAAVSATSLGTNPCHPETL